ncbi:MAG: retroviral-like aspartic protease family protein [Cyanobacteria bacterium SZAS-4]|nr:retroviral-like aspartic protease family protein [Cyanobacteria bacterium SZAS-4]
MLIGEAPAANKMQEAFAHYQAHRFKEATSAFDEYLQGNPRDANAMYYDALCNQQIGNMARAKSLYRMVVQTSPGSQIASYAESVLTKVDPSYRSATSSSNTSRSTTSPAVNSIRSSASASVIQGPNQANVYYKAQGSSIMVPVEINGHQVEMKLDTGAPGICIGRTQLASIGVRPPDGKATGFTGGSSNNEAIGTWDMRATVKVGPFIAPNAEIVLMETEDNHALLGQEFIKHFEYQVDQSAHCIRFTKKGTTGAAVAQGYTLPFTFREAGNRIIVEGEINGRKSKFMMDTGNTGSGIKFTSPEQAAAYGAPVPDGCRVGSFVGVSGAGSAYVYSVNHFRMGPIDRNDLSVAASVTSLQGGEEPLLGHEVFEGWQYTVDYDKKVIHLLRR